MIGLRYWSLALPFRLDCCPGILQLVETAAIFFPKLLKACFQNNVLFHSQLSKEVIYLPKNTILILLLFFTKAFSD